MAKAKTETAFAVELKRIPRDTVEINIVGTAPLIVNSWSEEAKRKMREKQQGKKVPRTIRDPKAEYEAAMYRFSDGRHGFPLMAFKQATVEGGARLFGGEVKMTQLRQWLSFLSDGFSMDGIQLAEIKSDDPIMREDMVTVGQGKADLRYRPEYRNWSAMLRIEFFPSVISVGSIVALVDAGGTEGIGQWRPGKNGQFGTYRVKID